MTIVGLVGDGHIHGHIFTGVVEAHPIRIAVDTTHAPDHRLVGGQGFSGKEIDRTAAIKRGADPGAIQVYRRIVVVVTEANQGAYTAGDIGIAHGDHGQIVSGLYNPVGIADKVITKIKGRVKVTARAAGAISRFLPSGGLRQIKRGARLVVPLLNFIALYGRGRAGVTKDFLIGAYPVRKTIRHTARPGGHSRSGQHKRAITDVDLGTCGGGLTPQLDIVNQRPIREVIIRLIVEKVHLDHAVGRGGKGMFGLLPAAHVGQLVS